MAKLTKKQVENFTDQAGISIDASPSPSMVQLSALIRLVRHDCAKKCHKIGMIHKKEDGAYPASFQAGAFECEVLALVDKAIEVILTIFSAAVGFGAGSFLLGVI